MSSAQLHAPENGSGFVNRGLADEMAKGLFGASSSIAKLYHAKFDDVATGLHRREIISSSAITSVFAQLSSKMSPYDCAEAVEVRW